jgi:hypothetical protein
VIQGIVRKAISAKMSYDRKQLVQNVLRQKEIVRKKPKKSKEEKRDPKDQVSW